MRISDCSSDGCSSDVDEMCSLQPGGDVCTEGPETRIIDGVPVTQACWAWKRDYVCHRFTPANDCGDLEANGSCSFLRTECLDEERDGACKVEERVYRCPTPGSAVTDAPQYICGRSEEHTSELQSLMRISYAVFCLNKHN